MRPHLILFGRGELRNHGGRLTYRTGVPLRPLLTFMMRGQCSSFEDASTPEVSPRYIPRSGPPSRPGCASGPVPGAGRSGAAIKRQSISSLGATLPARVRSLPVGRLRHQPRVEARAAKCSDSGTSVRPAGGAKTHGLRHERAFKQVSRIPANGPTGCKAPRDRQAPWGRFQVGGPSLLLQARSVRSRSQRTRLAAPPAWPNPGPR